MQLRLWILGLSITAFLAGLAAGMLFGLQVPRPGQERRAFADYETLLVRDFELDGLRRQALRGVLDRYERDVEDVKSRFLEQSEHELADLGLTYRRWIRDRVLFPHQRDDFDRLVAGLPAASHSGQ